MTSSVICGVDHSPHAHAAARFAALLAVRLRSRLVIVHAVPATVLPVVAVWPSREPDDRSDLRRLAAASGARLVTEVVERIDGVDVVGCVEEGVAPECLCRVAEEETAAFIVIGTNGDGAAAVVGSVSLATTRMAACPVVVVPPNVTGRPLESSEAESIVCGIADPDDVQPVRVAARLAQDLELPLLPVHIVPAQDDDRSGTTVAGIQSLLREEPSARAETALKATIDAVGASRAALDGPAIRVGEPAQQLARYAEEAQAAMVVVGTRGAVRSGLFGSVSRDLARTSTSPVVVCPGRA